MARERNDFIDRLQYLGLRIVSMLLHAWPVNLNLAGAKLIGSLLYAVDRRHRERALGNLRRSFPDMLLAQREIMARRSMQQLVMLGVDVIFTTRLIHIDTWSKYVRLANFQKTLEHLIDKNRGLILLTGHY